MSLGADVSQPDVYGLLAVDYVRTSVKLMEASSREKQLVQMLSQKDARPKLPPRLDSTTGVTAARKESYDTLSYLVPRQQKKLLIYPALSAAHSLAGRRKLRLDMYT